MKSESAFVSELRERGLYEVAQKICLTVAVRVDELIDETHFAPIVDARRRFAQHLKDRHHWSDPMIGRLLHRDHTTIFYLLRGPRKQVRPARSKR